MRATRAPRQHEYWWKNMRRARLPRRRGSALLRHSILISGRKGKRQLGKIAAAGVPGIYQCVELQIGTHRPI